MSVSTFWFYRVLAISALCLCGQSIVYSSNPIFFTLLAIATVVIFIICRGSDIAGFILVAVGPIVNMSALYRDPYVYNIEIIILTYMGFFFWKRGKEYTINNHRGISIPYIVMLLTIILSAFVHVVFYSNNLHSEIRLVRVFLIGGFLLVFLMSVENKHTFIYYKTTLITTLFISVTGLIEFCVRGIFLHNWKNEPQSVFSGSELLAVFLSTIIPFVFIGKPALKKGAWSHIAGIVVPASIALLMTTRSRTGIIALLIVTFFWGIQIVRTRLQKKTGIFIIMILVTISSLAIVALKTFPSGYTNLENPFGLLFSSRTNVWLEGIKNFTAAPLWGGGPGTNAYNLYIQLLSQYGIIVFVSFLIFAGVVFVQYYRGCREEPQNFLNKGIFGSIIASLITGFGESILGNQFGYYILFLLLLLGTTNVFKSAKVV